MIVISLFLLYYNFTPYKKQGIIAFAFHVFKLLHAIGASKIPIVICAEVSVILPFNMFSNILLYLYIV